MCVGKCSRIVGPCLLALGTLSVAANILLLFPGGTSKYLLEGHISKHAKVVPGVWGGGIPVTVFWSPLDVQSLPGCCPQAFISAVLSKLALLGAAACFVLSGVGLTNGPLCFYNTSETENYLYGCYTWSTCLEPAGVVTWNVVLFSLLLLISAAEMVLASLQILNGCLGCLCGFCEGNCSPRSPRSTPACRPWSGGSQPSQDPPPHPPFHPGQLLRNCFLCRCFLFHSCHQLC
uniref:Transmembrane 4 L6 family member 1 n=1 Tax=Calidris pygmaea TaxID=425635 RepID=A0A8C3KB90_9CHAR